MANKFLGALGLDALVNKIKDVIAKLDTKQDNLGAMYYNAPDDQFCLGDVLGVVNEEVTTVYETPPFIVVTNVEYDGTSNSFKYNPSSNMRITLIYGGGFYHFIYDGIVYKCKDNPLTLLEFWTMSIRTAAEEITAEEVTNKFA